MSTCSTGQTNARSIVIATIDDQTYENKFGEIANSGMGVDTLQGLFGFP